MKTILRTPSALRFFKLCVLFPDILFTQNNVAQLLLLYKFAQQKRLWYFNLCCMLATFKLVNKRYFFHFFLKHWEASFLFFSSSYVQLYYFFEFYSSNVTLTDFTPYYFYDGRHDPKFLLNYKDYFLRIDLVLFGLGWKALEGVRARTYNNFMRHHFFLNKSLFVETRRGLNQSIKDLKTGIRPLNQMLKRFLCAVSTDRFKTFYLKALRPTHGRQQLSLPPLKHHFFRNMPSIFSLLRGLSSLPLLLLRKERYFRISLDMWLMWISTSVFDRYSYLYKDWSRWDYDSGPQLFRFLAFSPYALSKTFSIWLGEWEDKLMEQYLAAPVFFFFFLTMDFLPFPSFLPRPKEEVFYNRGLRPPKRIFVYRILKLAVSRTFEQGLFGPWGRWRLRANNHSHWNDHLEDNYERWLPRLFMGSLLGRYHNVIANITYGVINTEYLQWRILNTTSVYKFLGGRLQLPLLYRRLELDYIIYYRFRFLWRIFRRHMRWKLKSLRLWNCAPPVFGRRKYKPRIRLFANQRGSEVKELGLLEQERLNLKQPNSKKIGFRLSIFVFFSLFSSWVIDLFRRSVRLCCVGFFSLAPRFWEKYFSFFSFYHTKVLSSMFSSQSAVRWWIANYRRRWGHYRRITMQNGIHSLNNPLFREVWMRFFHKMRRTGFKKGEQPYYCYDEAKDYLLELAEQVRRQREDALTLPGIVLIEE